MPISVKKYNNLQDQKYFEYCKECKKNNIEPAPQKRYFAHIPVNYGFVLEGACNSITWKKNKKDFY